MTGRDDRFLVGLDLGTTGAKAGVVDSGGGVAGTAFTPYPTGTPHPGWAEQDPAEWWSACANSIGQALKKGGVAGEKIAAIGVSGQMHGSVLLDGSGHVIRPCILWCDQRASEQCEWMMSELGAERLNENVSNPALPGFTAPKLLWVRRNEPDNYSRIEKVLLPKDYINYRLTGEVATEFSDASGTLLLDVAERKWSDFMVDALEMRYSWLPPLLESSDVVGKVTAEAAVACGLPEGTPVAAGGADNACGALGMGVISPGEIAVSIGSSGTVLAPVALPETDEGMRLHLFCGALRESWYLMGVMLSAGLSLRWFRDELGEPESSLAREGGLDPYALLDETAACAPPGSDGLLFLPYLTGERTPHADPNARGVLFGIDLTKSRAHVIRSILEGVVFGLNDSLGILRELGLPLESIVSGGGGSRSDLWRRIQCDVFDLPVAAAGESDSAIMGAAMLAGTAAGDFGSPEEPSSLWVSYGETYRPDPANRPVYERSYSRFRALYPDLRRHFTFK